MGEVISCIVSMYVYVCIYYIYNIYTHMYNMYVYALRRLKYHTYDVRQWYVLGDWMHSEGLIKQV